jgi:tetratricopeptide (TPR) repeat protein
MKLQALNTCLLMVSLLLGVPVLAQAQTADADSPAAAESAESAGHFPPCGTEPSETDVAAAQGAFQAGKVSFDEADYERAITYWEDAFRRDCTATALLLNLARAYELNEEPKNAVVALETYLDREPDTPERAPIERRIEVLEQKQAAQGQPATAPPAGQRTVSRTPRARHQSPPPGPPQKAKEPPLPAKPAPRRPIMPLIVGGAGLAVFIGAGAVYMDAMGEVNDAEQECSVLGEGTRTCRTSQTADAANSARLRANITGPISLLGAATAVGGVVWYILSKPKPPAGSAPKARGGKSSRTGSARIRLAPEAGHGFVGASLRGEF